MLPQKMLSQIISPKKLFLNLNHHKNDLKSKYKRQLEILGLCFHSRMGDVISLSLLAEKFKVEPLTIKRDLTELRSAGIDIHSTKKSGISMGRRPGDERMKEIVQQYTALTLSSAHVDRSIALLVNKRKDKALANLVVLQLCIEQNKRALIDYEKESDEVVKSREICPLLLFEADNYWRVLVQEKSVTKQFIVNKITKVTETPYTFRPLSPEKISDLFRYSWRSWLGEDKYSVKLRLSPKWANQIKPKQLMENEKLVKNKDGSMIYETMVNSLDEIAGWVTSRGEGVKVLEPKELKQRVIATAKGTLGNY